MALETLPLTEEMSAIVQQEIASGRFSSASEVLAAALRSLETEDEVYERKLDALRAAIDEGDASGDAEGDIFAEIRAEMGLPARVRSV